MKKSFLLLIFAIFVSLPVFSMSDNAKAEIEVLKRQKNIKQRIINEKIKEKEGAMETILYDNSLTDSEKTKQLAIIKHDLKQLYKQKQTLHDDYMKSKKIIKRNY